MSTAVWKIHLGGLASVAGVIALAYWFGARPAMLQRDRLAELRARIAEVRRDVELAEANERVLQEELESLGTLGADWAALRGEPRTLNERLAELTALAEHHGLRLTSTQPGDPERREFFTVRRITVAGSGGYTACAAFLHDLVDALPDLTVEGLELEAEGSERAREASFRFDLAWYADSAGDLRESPAGSG